MFRCGKLDYFLAFSLGHSRLSYIQDTIIKLQDEYAESKTAVGLDLETGDAMLPEDAGIW